MSSGTLSANAGTQGQQGGSARLNYQEGRLTFFGGLTDFMSSGPCVLLALEAPAAQPPLDRADLLADRLFGDPRRGHPVAGFGQLAATVERRTHADSRLAGVGHYPMREDPRALHALIEPHLLRCER